MFSTTHSCLFPSSTMTRGKKVCKNLCWAIARMLKLLPMDQVVHISGISERQVRRISRMYELTGNPYTEPAKKSGWPRQITADQEQVCYTETSDFCTLLTICYSPFKGPLIIVVTRTWTNWQTHCIKSTASSTPNLPFGDASRQRAIP